MDDAFAPLEARDFLEKSHGVQKATVTTGEVAGSLKSDYFVKVRVTVDPSDEEGSLRATALRAVQTGWATRIAHTPDGVQLEILGKPGINVPELLDGSGFDVYGDTAPSAIALVSAESLQRKWGDWPGTRPGAS